jgi:hypothetical protein
MLQDLTRKAIEKDPLIFTKTIRTQMYALVVRPFKQLCAAGDPNLSSFPYAILIDGLDECSGEENQAELLACIKICLLDNALPFRVFLASRPEWAIRSALNSEPEGYLYRSTYHIQLSDKYDATNDIRRYLWRKLRDIGSRSHDPRARSRLWPREEDIEKLVVAASGQFVYAATVVKYLSERRSSPVDRLQIIVTWTLAGGQLASRPFEGLDTLYAGILRTAKELYEAVDTNRERSFLMLLRVLHINSDFRAGRYGWTARDFDEVFNLERGGHEALVSDLHSLVVFPPRSTPPTFIEVHFYHRSFFQFLDSEPRAKDLFIPETLVRKYALESIVQGIIKSSLEPSESISALTHVFEKLRQYMVPRFDRQY